MEEEPSGNNDIVSTLGNTSIRDTGESEDEEPTEQILKLVIVGDGTTGKTSICTRFAQKNFNKKYSQVKFQRWLVCSNSEFQTIGVDFFSRRILLPHNVPVLLQVNFKLLQNFHVHIPDLGHWWPVFGSQHVVQLFVRSPCGPLCL